MRIDVSITDVRNAANLSDYTGELQARTSLRITDRGEPGGDEPATVVDTPLPVTVPCVATGGSGDGAGCSVLDDVRRGHARAPCMRAAARSGSSATIRSTTGARTASRAPLGANALFARQGVFVP